MNYLDNLSAFARSHGKFALYLSASSTSGDPLSPEEI